MNLIVLYLVQPDGQEVNVHVAIHENGLLTAIPTGKNCSQLIKEQMANLCEPENQYKIAVRLCLHIHECYLYVFDCLCLHIHECFLHVFD